ncbi:DinB family protein [Nonomuraea sp. NPDC049421]
MGRRLPSAPPAPDAMDVPADLAPGQNPHPVSVLRATPEQLRELYATARARDELITVGLDQQPRDRDDQVAVAVFGPRDHVTAATEHLPHEQGPPVPGADGRRRRAEMFPTADDRRFDPPATGDERRMLTDFLRAQRSTLEMKCSGLDTELSRRSVEPSTLSLLGLVRHLADVERRWFRRVLAGHDAPPLFSSATRPDGDFDGAAPDRRVVAEAWEAWRSEVAFADAFTADAPDLNLEGHDEWRGRVSLRWVLIHMIEEYARHNGHADLLRERIDGTIGL